MLVLSRRPKESILIGQTIRITVISIDRNQVRLGIVAPNDVSILREEIVEQSTENKGTDSEGHNQARTPDPAPDAIHKLFVPRKHTEESERESKCKHE